MRSIRALVVFLTGLALFALPVMAFADTSFATMLEQFEQQYQLPAGILWKVALAENGGKASGCASTSSACGMFQFITSTWLADTKALYGAPLDPSLRNDPTKSARAAAFELGTIKSQIGPLITQVNVNLSAGLYLGYFLGSGGAKRLLIAYMQNPSQNACSLLPSQCSSNQTVFAGKSIAQLINWAAQKMQANGVPNIPGNFADQGGISYAYSYADIQPSNFLPATTVIPANPYGADATVFPQTVTNPATVPTTNTLPISTIPNQTTATTPTPAQSPATTQSTATSGGACKAQYYCSNNTAYYESDSCATSVFQQCSYGCLGTICAPSPAVSSTSASLYTQSSSPLGATLQSSNTIANPVLIGSTVSSSSIPSLVNSTINTIIAGTQNNPSQGSPASTQSSFNANATYTTDTLTLNQPSQSYEPSVSPLSAILNQLRSALSGLMSYLSSL